MEKPKVKVNINLEKVKKHHFWILLGVLLVAGLVTWNMATAALRDKYQANAAQIGSAYSQLMGLQGAGMPPNDKFIAVLNEEQNKLHAQSLDAWKLFFEEQGERLKWPERVAAIGELSSNEEIPEPLRASYMNNVLLPQWQAIFDKANLRRVKEGAIAPTNLAPGESRPQMQEFEGVVYWDPVQRRALQERYQTTVIPSTVQVRCTQEDLWIFDSLIDIVLKMNEGKEDPVAAVIKSIDLLEVGPPAVEEVLANPGMTDSDAHERGGRRAEHGEDTDPDSLLLTNRYLNENNEPVTPTAAKENPPFAEFRQVFVVMRFVMDQRRIPELLTACANSHLPIEARQVLLTFVDVDSKSDVRSQVNSALTAGRIERGPYDALVEVRGIVYLYNKPDQEKLGTGSAPQPARRQLGVPIAPPEPI